MTQLIDIDKFSENLSLDPEVISELYSVFVDESKTLLITLRDAIIIQNYDMVYESVHSLKGICSSLMVYDAVIYEFISWQNNAKNNIAPDFDRIVNIVNSLVLDLKALFQISNRIE